MKKILFHGTSHRFAAFSEDFIGVGGDANSALGVHLAEWPESAAEYAESSQDRDRRAQSACVLVVEAEVSNSFQGFDYYEFFGLDDQGNQVASRQAFAQIRQDLLDEGFDTIEYEDGEQQIVVILEPSNTNIIARLTVDEAYRLSEILSAGDEPFDDDFRRQSLDRILNDREKRRTRELHSEEAPSPG